MLGRLLRELGLKGRRDERVERDQLAHLFAGVEPLGPARLLDLSATGAQVERLEPFPGDRATRLLMMDSSQLLDVEPVWTRGDRMGLRVTASQHIRGYTEGEADRIKAWWIANRLSERP